MLLSAGVLGSSPPGHYIHKHLCRISLNRHQHQRAQLQAEAVTGWLHKHPAAASGVVRLTLDLSHHSHHDFDRQQLEVLLAALPRVQSIQMLGAVDGTDAYEPLGKRIQLVGVPATHAHQPRCIRAAQVATPASCMQQERNAIATCNGTITGDETNVFHGQTHKGHLHPALLSL